MNKFKALLESTKFSFDLVYHSSGLWIILYFILSLIASTLGLASTYALKFLLDNLTDGNIVSLNVIICISGYILILLIAQGNTSFQKILYDTIFKKAEHFYDCKIAERLSVLPLSFIDSSTGRDTIDEVRYTRRTAVEHSYKLIRVISSMYTFFVAFITLFAFNIWFSIIFIVLTCLPLIVQLIFEHKADDMRQKQAPDNRKFCYYRWMLTDPWPSKDVRVYNLTKPIRKRYDEVKNEYVAANKRLDKKKLFGMLLSEFIYRSGEILFIAFVIFKAIRGEIGIGDIALYTGLALSVLNSFSDFMYIIIYAYFRTSTLMMRVLSFFSADTKNNKALYYVGEFRSLEFKNVYFKYPQTDNYILRGVSFKINKGDKLSLIGINGSGKSTIIKLMLGLYEIEAGEILINGYPITTYDISDVRKMFSVLFQNFIQYPISLRDNIALSDYARAFDDDSVISALKQSGVYDELSDKLSNGIDSYMTRRFDDNGTELSKGQWQKIALARAYFKNSEILIFDEPSSALDAEAEDRIFKNFEQISEGKTGIMISHRISAARMTNKIIVLDSGVISECGTHEELIAENGLYARLYGLQRKKYATGVKE